MKSASTFLRVIIHNLRLMVSPAWHWYMRWRYRTVKSAGVAVLTVTLGLLLGNTIFSSAVSVTLVPNTDVTTGWPATGGTTDSTCAGGTHCDFVDEGTTDKTTDYVTTSGSTGGGEVEEYGLTSPADVSTATQVVVRVYAESTTNANGGTLDDLSINLRVSGTLQTAGTCTPAYNSWTACTATFNGSWNQTAVDSMQAQITRVKQGSGNPSGQADTLQIANVYATLTYTSSIVLNQSAYRWFNNTDSGDVTFANKWGGTGTQDNVASTILQTSDGGYAVGGTTKSFGAGQSDAFIAKYDSTGTMSWSKTWGGTSNDTGESLALTSDGGYIVVGQTASFGTGLTDAFIAKYDSTGTMSWSKTWGGTSNDRAYSVIQSADGGYVMVGSTTSYTGGGLDDMYIAKFTSSGTLSWSRTWGGTNNDIAKKVIQTSDTGYAVAGTSGSSNVFLVKYSNSGSLSWSKLWGGASGCNSLTETSDNGLVIAGSTSSFGAGGFDAFVAKFTSTGTFSWSTTWGTSNTDVAESIVETSDGGLAYTGYGNAVGLGGGPVILIKLTSAGAFSWGKEWDGASGSYGYSIAQADDDGYVIAGSTFVGSSNQQVLLLKFTSTGAMTNCSTVCKTDGVDYTGIVKTDGVDYTSTTQTEGVDYTYTHHSDGVDYNSAMKADGTDYNSTKKTDGTDYTSTLTVLINSAPAIDVGAALAGQDTAATAPGDGTPFRLRLDMHVSGAQLAAGYFSYKLKYAEKGGAGSCSAVSSGTYSDVTDSTTIRYYNNPKAGNGLPLQTNAADPVHSADSNIAQSYHEYGTSIFTTTASVSAGQDGMWDFALVGQNTLQNTTYCFKVVKSDGTDLNTYTVYPEITTPAASFTQQSYRMFDGIDDQGVTFAEGWGGNGSDIARSVIHTSDGGYAMTGYTGSFPSNYDVFIAKFDSSGVLSWSKTWGATNGGYNTAYSIIQTSDGGYAIACSTSGYGAGNYDACLLKYTSTGTLSWSKTWGSAASNEEAYSIVQTSDGGYALTGRANATIGAGQDDVILLKYTSTGTLSWSKTWGGTSYEQGASIIQTSDGGYAITGYSQSFTSGSKDMCLIKFTSTGTLSWSKTWGGAAGAEEGKSVVQTSDGGYAITGYTKSFGGDTTDVFLAKYTSTGTLSWSKTWGGSTNNYGFPLVQTSDGGYAVVGSTLFGYGSTDMFLAKFTSTGTLSWSKTLGYNSTDTAFSVVQTNDGGYAVAGYTYSFGGGTSVALLAKYKSDGSIGGCGTYCRSDGTDYTSTMKVDGTIIPVLNKSDGTDYTSTNYSDGTDYTSVNESDGTDYTSTNYSDGTDYTSDTTPIVAVSGGIAAGSALAPENKPYDMPSLLAVYLGVVIRVDNSGISAGSQAFKLQYALRGSAATCSAVTSGNYSDVTSATTLRYYDNPTLGNPTTLLAGSNDLTDGSRTIRAQTYNESNNFSNSQSTVYAGEDAMWLLPLTVDNAALKGKDFCVRVATSAGSQLGANNIAETSYGPLMQTLLHGGNWFSRAGVKQNISL